MNNKEQNANPNGISQNHHPNQGYPQRNNPHQRNGYNGQNPQNFNRNVNNKNLYQNQNPQANNVNNPQFQGYLNGQNQPHNNANNPQYRGQDYRGQNLQNNNMNNPQFRAQDYNGQNLQYNNMNNPQYVGQDYNGQNPQFVNQNNPQFSNQNGYNIPNQFNPQFGNNQNFNPMNRGPKMDSKMVGYITAAVATIVVVLMIFMFSSGSGKLGGGTPEEAVKEVILAISKGDYKKSLDFAYFKTESDRDNAKKRMEDNSESDIKILERATKTTKNAEIIKSHIDGDTAEVKVNVKKDQSDSSIIAGDRNIVLRKVNNRWFLVNGFY